jgi:hypothetical protein
MANETPPIVVQPGLRPPFVIAALSAYAVAIAAVSWPTFSGALVSCAALLVLGGALRWLVAGNVTAARLGGRAGLCRAGARFIL